MTADEAREQAIRIIGLLIATLAIQAASAIAGQDNVEHLALVGPDHQVVAVVDGNRMSVVLSPDVDALVMRPGARITLVHNHPDSVGLSLFDLVHLAKPGVAAIIAIGADGSRYEAARGARYDEVRFEARQYKVANDRVLASLLTTRGHEPSLPTFDGQIAHLTSLALAKAGVIVYRAILGDDRAAEWRTFRPQLGMVAECAASAVRRAEHTR